MAASHPQGMQQILVSTTQLFTVQWAGNHHHHHHRRRQSTSMKLKGYFTMRFGMLLCM